MASYKRFEDLPVWQAAVELYEQVSDFLQARPPKVSYSFRDQLERAALSVSNNIAEGFERGTTPDTISFIYIARGSAGEVRSMLNILASRKLLADLHPQIGQMRQQAENCSRQLQGWAQSLIDSEIRGQRHHDSRSRAIEDEDKRRENFQRTTLRMLPANHPLRIEFERKHGKLE